LPVIREERNMKRRRLVTPLLLCVAGLGAMQAARAAPEVFVIDPTHTFPMFEVSHLGYSFHRGRFNVTTGRITIDPQAQLGSIDVVIDANSLDTGHDVLERELRGKDFFDVERHPTLRFQSDRLLFDGAQPVGAHGVLTLLGIGRPVTLRLDHFRCATHLLTRKYTCGANVLTTIQRSEFGMSKGVPFVGDDVRITIQVEAQRD
jgi:polyisoprenoid-binding protein YceI